MGRTPDGRVHFVHGVAPGDLALVAAESASPSKSRVALLRVLEPAPGRVDPVCPHATRCGGCDWMHVSQEVQVEQHVGIVREQLSRASSELPTIVSHAELPVLAYRSRARFALSAARGRIELGYRATRSHDIVSVESCAVLAPGILEVATELANLLRGAKGQADLSVSEQRTSEGQTRFVAELGFRGELPGEVFGGIDRLVAEARLAGVSVVLPGASVPMIFGDPRPAMLGFDGQPLWLAAGGFGQPSEAGGRLLAERVRELSAAAGREVIELFAGAGTLSIALAADASGFSSVEADAAAVACARENFDSRGLSGRLSCGDAESVSIAPKAEVVVLDPPRTGAAGAMLNLIKARTKRIVYVSCDASTLARDATVLCNAGYQIANLEMLELFPQTSHHETICVFTRGGGSGDSVGKSSRDSAKR